MKVILIAKTGLTQETMSLLTDEPFGAVYAADHLAEVAGRSCYESWDRPNPQTARNPDYLRSIIDKHHFSILEHASATFYVQDVSRSLTHELVRHRHLSFSQRSQRYVDETSSGWCVPDVLQTISDDRVREQIQDHVDVVNHRAREAYQDVMLRLAQMGVTGKKAREAARSVLPNSTHTSIVVTGNHRAWRDVISKRWHVAADAEIRMLAGEILRQLSEIAPATYQDFDLNRPFGMPPEGA